MEHTSNATVDLILSRLPNKPILSPRDISDALGLATITPILDAIEEGKLEGAKLGRYMISHDEAVRFVKTLGV